MPATQHMQKRKQQVVAALTVQSVTAKPAPKANVSSRRRGKRSSKKNQASETINQSTQVKKEKANSLKAANSKIGLQTQIEKSDTNYELLLNTRFKSGQYLPTAPKANVSSQRQKIKSKQNHASKAIDKNTQLKNEKANSSEAANLKRGLNTKIEEGNKGYDLLVKMGYESGKGLGKNSEGILEPIKMQIKSDRKGLGTPVTNKLVGQQLSKNQRKKEDKRIPKANVSSQCGKIKSKQNHASKDIDKNTQLKKEKANSSEAANLKRGLNTKIEEGNKGYDLLVKMGYESGKGLGKNSEGILEPIKIQIKSDRKGLGTPVANKLVGQQLSKNQRKKEDKRIPKANVSSQCGKIKSKQNHASKDIDQNTQVKKEKANSSEAANLKRGLNTKIEEGNKGYDLFVKMCYESGKGLGKSSEGILEPIKMQIKSDRKGLGTPVTNKLVGQQLSKNQRKKEDKRIPKANVSSQCGKIKSKQNHASKDIDKNTQLKKEKANSSEAANLKRGLNTKIEEGNKGYDLLVKMGYESGKGLGKNSEGILEPIKIQIKSDRKGLGTPVANKLVGQQLSKNQRKKEDKRIPKANVSSQCGKIKSKQNHASKDIDQNTQVKKEKANSSEAANLKRGLNTKIEEGNKGYDLFVKMCYESGKGLGRSSEGILEPIKIQTKSDRKGSGTPVTNKLVGQQLIKNQRKKEAKEMQVVENFIKPTVLYTNAAEVATKRAAKKNQKPKQVVAAIPVQQVTATQRGNSSQNSNPKIINDTFSFKDPCDSKLILSLRRIFRSEIKLMQLRLLAEVILTPAHNDNDFYVVKIFVENNRKVTDHVFEFIRTELIGWIGVYQQEGMDTPIFHSILNNNNYITIICDNKFAFECVERCIRDISEMEAIGFLSILLLPPITPLIYCFNVEYEGIATDPSGFLKQLHLHKRKLYSYIWVVVSHKVCAEKLKTYFSFLVDERSALALNFNYTRSFYICMQQVTFHNGGIISETV